MNKPPARRACLTAFILFVILSSAKPAAAVEALLLQDTYVDNGTTGGKPPPNNSNYGSGTDLRIFKGSGRIGRSFLKFSLGTLPLGTSASDITQARLRFWVNSNSTLLGSITLSPVTTPWDELVLKDSSTGSLTFGLPKLSDLAVSSISNFISIDVTDWVKGWLKGTLLNEGIEIEASATTSTLNVAFDSKESNQTSHEPRLDISLSKIGPPGPAGPQGPQGITGLIGPAGATGPAGTTGNQGPAGPAGAVGAQGPRGVTGADGSKWFSWTGPPAENVGALFDYYLNLTTGDVWQKVSNQGGPTWSMQGNIRGAEGPAGVAGVQGPIGATGAAGAQGLAGPTGPTGLQGPPGLQGSSGPPGVAGPAGDIGPAGPTGPPGPPAVWPTHIEPQGDLAMGEFTQGSIP